MGLFACLLPGGSESLEVFPLEGSLRNGHVQLSHFTGRESEAGRGKGLGQSSGSKQVGGRAGALPQLFSSEGRVRWRTAKVERHGLRAPGPEPWEDCMAPRAQRPYLKPAGKEVGLVVKKLEWLPLLQVRL